MRAFLTRHAKMIDAPHLPRSAFCGSPLEKNELALFTVYCPDELIHFDALTTIDRPTKNEVVVHIIAITSLPYRVIDTNSPLSIEMLETLARQDGLEITLPAEIAHYLITHTSMLSGTNQHIVQ